MKAIGIIMLAMPFVVLAYVSYKQSGLKATVITFSAGIFLVAWVFIAVNFAYAGDHPLTDLLNSQLYPKRVEVTIDQKGSRPGNLTDEAYESLLQSYKDDIAQTNRCIAQMDYDWDYGILYGSEAAARMRMERRAAGKDACNNR